MRTTDAFPSGHAGHAHPAAADGAPGPSGDEHAGQVLDDLEYAILRSYLTAQSRVVMRRHPYEDFLLVRTLADQHQHAAWEAKRGHQARSRVMLRAVEQLHPATHELSLVCRVTADPAWALIDWTEGRHRRAMLWLRSALRACAVLASTYDHDYLSPKRIYLASHIARVHVSLGATDKASELAAALVEVMDGAADRWPFDDPASLSVPIGGNERLMLEAQLQKLRSAAESR